MLTQEITLKDLQSLRRDIQLILLKRTVLNKITISKISNEILAFLINDYLKDTSYSYINWEEYKHYLKNQGFLSYEDWNKQYGK